MCEEIGVSTVALLILQVLQQIETETMKNSMVKLIYTSISRSLINHNANLRCERR